MYALLAYDIADNRQRAKLHKFLKEFGLNTQKSVFECQLTQESLQKIIQYIRNNLDEAKDLFFIYGLCANCYQRIETTGQAISLTLSEHMVI